MPKETNSRQNPSLWDPVFRFHFQEIPSTNNAAMQWLRESRPGQMGTFTAAHQTAGRGQHGRIWEHRAHQDLAWSLAVHFIEPRHAKTIDSAFWMRLNMGITQAVERCLKRSSELGSATEVRVKWPNDLLILQDGSWKKCAGILLENHWKGSNLHGIVIGIGVNIAPFPPSNNWVALQSLTEQELTAERCQVLLEQELGMLFPLTNLRFDPITLKQFDLYQKSLFGWNEVPQFEWKKAIHQARFLGINKTGQAQLEWVTGPHSGTITTHVSTGDLNWIHQ